MVSLCGSAGEKTKQVFHHKTTSYYSFDQKHLFNWFYTQYKDYKVTLVFILSLTHYRTATVLVAWNLHCTADKTIQKYTLTSQFDTVSRDGLEKLILHSKQSKIYKA